MHKNLSYLPLLRTLVRKNGNFRQQAKIAFIVTQKRQKLVKIYLPKKFGNPDACEARIGQKPLQPIGEAPAIKSGPLFPEKRRGAPFLEPLEFFQPQNLKILPKNR